MRTKLIHPVSGEIKEVSREEFLAMFDPSIRKHLVEKSMLPGVEALVVFECIQLDSSALGRRTALIVGPTCTYRAVDMVKPEAKLGQTPSQFQFPVAIWYV